MMTSNRMLCVSDKMYTESYEGALVRKKLNINNGAVHDSKGPCVIINSFTN
jgi:hypothetical protein